MTEVPANEPFTTKHAIRLVGTVVLLIAAIWVCNFWQQKVKLPEVAYNAATLTPAQVAKQNEILTEKRSLVDIVEVRGQTRYLYHGRKQTWGTKRPDWLDQNDQPILEEQDKQRIAEVAKAAIMMKKPPWLMQGNGRISVVDYNFNLGGLQRLIWIGFAFSVAAYIILFWQQRPSDDAQSARRWSKFGCLPVTLVILGTTIATATQPWPYLIAFGAPFLSMLLLWGLTREPKSADPEEVEVAPAEAAEVPSPSPA